MTKLAVVGEPARERSSGSATGVDGAAVATSAAGSETAGADGRDGRVTAAAVVSELRRLGHTLATAESLTGGLLGAAVTAVPGSSAAYRGGVIAYATDLKHTLLGVDADQLERFGAVDGDTAAAMAAGVRLRTAATVAVATTGVAGPGGQEGHPPGTVYLGWADERSASSVRLALSGTRDEIRTATVQAALDLVLDRLRST